MRVVRSQVWLAALAAGLVLGLASMSSASEKGKQLFVKHGCWQCHGFVGQGGIAGPALVPEVMPLEAMISFRPQQQPGDAALRRRSCRMRT